MTDCIIIGGGASGMLAAYEAAGCGEKVLLLEKNEKLGKKIYITGKGRCNVTNHRTGEEFLAYVPRNASFLRSALSRFDSEDMMKLLGKLGCPVKTERGERVFPVSEKASDITKALEKGLRERGVTIRLRTEVKELMYDENGEAVCGVRTTDGEELPAARVIVATGGLSYPGTGSTGDGYRFAKEAGHKVTELYPCLVPLRTESPDLTGMAGLSLKNIELKAKKKGVKKALFEERGELLFTHDGISGPLVLSLTSAVVGKVLPEELQLSMDMKPAVTREQLEDRFLRFVRENPNKELMTLLLDFLPTKIAELLLRSLGIDRHRALNAIMKGERQRIIDFMKNIPFTVREYGAFREAVITRGGISVREVDPKTMESKKKKGLYFAGEVLDLDGRTGGFNLQIAWSSGYAAGRKEKE